MMYYGLAVIFFGLAFFFYRKKQGPYPDMVWIFYGLTSLLTGFMVTSSMRFFATIRLFVYIASDFVIAFLPIFLVVLLGTLFKDMQEKHEQAWYRVITGLMVMLLSAAIIFMVWGAFNLQEIRFENYIDMVIEITLYFIANFLAFCLLNWVLQVFPLKVKGQVLMVLGQKIDNPQQFPRLLARRLDQALAYYIAQPLSDQNKIYFLVTGGPIAWGDTSEAAEMRDYLIERGVAGDKIILEPLAHNTFQNFYYGRELLVGPLKAAPVIVFTSRFHVLRSYCYGQASGMKATYRGTRVAWYLWPYYLIRDYLGFLLVVKHLNYLYLLLIFLVWLYQIIYGIY